MDFGYMIRSSLESTKQAHRVGQPPSVQGCGTRPDPGIHLRIGSIDGIVGRFPAPLVAPTQAYFAPEERHLELERDGRVVRVRLSAVASHAILVLEA